MGLWLFRKTSWTECRASEGRLFGGRGDGQLVVDGNTVSLEEAGQLRAELGLRRGDQDVLRGGLQALTLELLGGVNLDDLGVVVVGDDGLGDLLLLVGGHNDGV